MIDLFQQVIPDSIVSSTPVSREMKDLSRVINSAMIQYEMAKLTGNLADYHFGSGGTEKRAQNELTRLSILQKKRELGIPTTDDDLEGRPESILDRAKQPTAAIVIEQTRQPVMSGVQMMMQPAMPMMMQPVMQPVMQAAPAVRVMDTGLDILKGVGKGRHGLIKSLISSLK